MRIYFNKLYFFEEQIMNLKIKLCGYKKNYKQVNTKEIYKNNSMTN